MTLVMKDDLQRLSAKCPAYSLQRMTPLYMEDGRGMNCVRSAHGS